MKKILTLISSALLFSFSTVQASNLLLEAGLHIGGDELASVTYTDGYSDSMDAGGLISLSAGLSSDIDEDLNLRTTIGMKFDSLSASNGELDFNRYPFSVVLFKKGEKFNVGIGATYHLNPEFSSSGFGGNYTVNFDNAFGLVAEIDLKLKEKAYVGLKLTAIDYATSNAFGPSKINGNSLGIVIGLKF